MKELSDVSETKAELMELLKMREESTLQLQELHRMVKKLEIALGEPKVLLLLDIISSFRQQYSYWNR